MIENFNLNIDELYKRLEKRDEWSAISLITKFLIEKLKINPLEYVTKVYPSMYERLDIKSIEIPDSITEIGDYAFKYCESLKSVIISNSVGKIGFNAFCGCYLLESITILNPITKIGGWAFEFCPKLIIKCKENSYADKHAKANNIKVEYID